MNKIERLIQELCPEGVEYKKLENCCTILDNKREPITKSARPSGRYPYYGANGIQDYVSSYIFEGKFVLVGEDGSVLTKNGNPVVTWAEGKIWVNNHAHIIKEIDGICLKYLFYYIKILKVSKLIHGNIPKLTGKDFRLLQIPIPPIAIQEQIVKILDSFAELEAELEAELDCRKRQYEYYREQLLNFEGKEGVEWKKLGEVVKIMNGKDYKNHSSGNIPVYGTGGVMAYVDSCAYNLPSVLLPRKGSINKIYYVDTPFWTVDTLYYTKINGEFLTPKFLYYILLTKNIEKLNTATGSIPSLTQAVLNKIPIPIPPMAEQERIVGILDKMEKMTSDLREGLPAEIAARHAQYIYYREQLLNFKKRA